MTALLGLEVSGVDAILTVVDRRGQVVSALRERLSAPAAQWWSTHPDERFRAVTALLDTALREGLLAGGIAAVGLAATPGLVFLGPEFEVIAPRALPWGEVLDGVDPTNMAAVLEELTARAPQVAAKVGAVLSTLDFLRFRLTGALGVNASFAWRTGLTHMPPRATSWDTEAILARGFRFEAFAPIFDAPVRVGVIHPDIAGRHGVSTGVWVHAGAEPVAASLSLHSDAATTSPPIVLETENGWQAWERCASPAAWRGDVTTIGNDSWWRRLPVAELDPPKGKLPADWSECLIDFTTSWEPSTWPESLPCPAQVAAGAGTASIGAAVQAGLAIGWWKDARMLRRKYLRPLPYPQWRRTDPQGA